MNKFQAERLWKELDLSWLNLAAIVVSAEYIRDYPDETVTCGTMRSVYHVAFLREWADALEGKE